MKIPLSPVGAKAVVVNPLADEDALLRCGIIVARHRADWHRLSKSVSSVESGHDEKQRQARAKENTVGVWMLASPRPGIIGRSYFRFIRANSARLIPRVIDGLLSTGEVDVDQIGFSGSSTAGFIVLEAMADDPRVSASVVRAACGEYNHFLRSSSLALNNEARWLPLGKLRLDSDYSDELALREPVGRAELYPPRPLLMLNGDRDAAIPLACVRPTVAAFEQVYELVDRSDRFSAITYADTGHGLGQAARDDALKFWQRWFGCIDNSLSEAD